MPRDSTAIVPWRGPRVALFDGAPEAGFGPWDDLRTVPEHRLGVLTAIERVRLATGHAPWLAVHPDRRALVSERSHDLLPCNDDSVVAVDARCTLTSDLRAAAVGLGEGEAIVQSGRVLAVRTTARAVHQHGASGAPMHTRASEWSIPAWIDSPWRALDLLPQTIEGDLSLLAVQGGVGVGGRRMDMGDRPLLADTSATICPGVVLDGTRGSIYLGAHCVIRPGAVLVGPCAVMDHAWVTERSLVKAHSVIGPWCKVGGEVGSVIFQSHANKVHDGHLGDCLVGEWVNIGAGAVGSNLLNTYGEVATRLAPDGGVLRTGRSFYGGVVGDHVKVGIMAAMGTGSSFGTGAMIACDRPPACVERFAWITTQRQARFRWDRFEETARAMMARRGCAPGAALLARLRALHALGESD